MRTATVFDLTTTEAEPSRRADPLLALETDELAARRLRGQIRADQARNRTPLTGYAVHRAILAVDIEGSTRRTNPIKGVLRHTMYELLEAALRTAGIGEQARDQMVDRGDSTLALIHPVDDAPKLLLLDTVVPTLAELLVEHNRRNPEQCFRLRVVVHAGEVHNDGRGWFGESLDLAFRLLDAPEAKRTLIQTVEPLVLVVSEAIYESIVIQGYQGIDSGSFKHMARVQVGDRRHRGWIHTPEHTAFDDIVDIVAPMTTSGIA